MSDDVTLTGTEYLRVIPRTKPVPELILDEITPCTATVVDGSPKVSSSRVTDCLRKVSWQRGSVSDAPRFGRRCVLCNSWALSNRVTGVIQGKGSFLRQTYVLPLASDWARISRMGLISQVMAASGH
jgi:hypothetical protein